MVVPLPMLVQTQLLRLSRSRVQLQIHCRLPTRGTADSPHQTLLHAFTPGLLDKTNSPTQHHLDRQLLALMHLGNKLELAHHPHLPHDVSRWLWTLSFNAYVNR